jgi:aspartyl-tRNA(Asn)/glutamyl-tRNA(Gln) amidotransferase subunit B
MNLMDFDVVIGLEVHCQLNSHSKIFAPDPNSFGSEPNTNVSVITLAHPGVLPMLNQEVVKSAVKLGLAFDCEINPYNFFDRKNYFYPDLPKGYQVSQDKRPICLGGIVKFKIKNGKNYADHQVQLHHIHMEEDAGKSIHDLDPQYTLLDYNRAGTPLLEIVSEPCIDSPEKAAAYLSEIRKTVRHLGISDGNMEEGSLRADLNISLKPKGAQKLGTKVEIKNMNSIKFLQKAAEFEIERQTKVLLSGGVLEQETRGFDPEKGSTYSMRVKESMNDYRYFPEPDLAPLHISSEDIEQLKKQMPALPFEIFKSLKEEQDLSEEQAYLLSDDSDYAHFFYETLKLVERPKIIANWLLSNLKGQLNEHNLQLAESPVKPTHLAELILAVDQEKISHSVAQKLLNLLMEGTKGNILDLAASNGWLQNSDSDELNSWVEVVLKEQAAKVEEYKKGKKGLIGMFVGEIMKKSKGSADPKKINALLIEKLNQ